MAADDSTVDDALVTEAVGTIVDAVVFMGIEVVALVAVVVVDSEEVARLSAVSA